MVSDESYKFETSPQISHTGGVSINAHFEVTQFHKV